MIENKIQIERVVVAPQERERFVDHYFAIMETTIPERNELAERTENGLHGEFENEGLGLIPWGDLLDLGRYGESPAQGKTEEMLRGLRSGFFVQHDESQKGQQADAKKGLSVYRQITQDILGDLAIKTSLMGGSPNDTEEKAYRERCEESNRELDRRIKNWQAGRVVETG